MGERSKHREGIEANPYLPLPLPLLFSRGIMGGLLFRESTVYGGWRGLEGEPSAAVPGAITDFEWQMLAQSAVGRLKQVIKAPVATPGWIWMDASLCLHRVQPHSPFLPSLSLSLPLSLPVSLARPLLLPSLSSRQRVTLLLLFFLLLPPPSYYNIHLSSRALNAPLRKCSFFARQSFSWEVIRRLLPPAG